MSSILYKLQIYANWTNALHFSTNCTFQTPLTNLNKKNWKKSNNQTETGKNTKINLSHPVDPAGSLWKGKRPIWPVRCAVVLTESFNFGAPRVFCAVILGFFEFCDGFSWLFHLRDVWGEFSTLFWFPFTARREARSGPAYFGMCGH